MKSLLLPIIHAWDWWFKPRSTDPTVRYRERALRFLLPVFFALRIIAFANAYFVVSAAPPRYFPAWVAAAVILIPFSVSFLFLLFNRVDWAGIFFLANWFLTDILNLPADGYWYAGLQVSLVLQVVLAVLLLPSRAILPFWLLELVTFGAWGYWLDINYFDPLLVPFRGQIADFTRTVISLGAQGTIILLIVSYLRLGMESSLRRQQATIKQLENEITERKRMEAERENFIRELNEKNTELERFTYTVSHDLKSPLVTIKGFLGMLKKDLKENRQDHIQKDFEHIAEAADKMGILLSELLELSRIGRIANPSEEFDLGKLTRDALETLDGRLRAQNVTVAVSSDLPTVYMDRSRMREVMENLIDNAAKYMGDQPNPLIEIGSRKSDTETIVFVKDNGIGIEPRFHERIFGLFEKLSAEGEGTGIGLAIVKRIVETHGGRIWVESEGLGKGAAFCFTLPVGAKRKE